MNMCRLQWVPLKFAYYRTKAVPIFKIRGRRFAFVLVTEELQWHLTEVCYIIYRILVGGKGEKVRLIFIVSISLVLNLFLYIDPANFQGGASLGVLFYSLIIWLLTTLVTVVICIFF